jgi:hypothetical protein
MVILARLTTWLASLVLPLGAVGRCDANDTEQDGVLAFGFLSRRLPFVSSGKPKVYSSESNAALVCW